MPNEIVMTDLRKDDRMYQEAIKNLRANLQFAGVGIKCITISSCFPNEGKSDVVFQLCREIGNLDKKVLLLDCDIRKSAFASRYSIGKSVKGLSHYLSGQATFDELIYSTNYHCMDIIFAGSMAPNPTELLASSTMEELMVRLRDMYDYVLLDTPPMATMSDALIVSKWCDGAIMVLESGRVSYRMAQRVKQLLTNAGCRILGAVLNKVDTANDRYYSKYGYYKKYGHYGKYGYYGYGSYYGYYGKSEKEEKQEDNEQ